MKPDNFIAGVVLAALLAVLAGILGWLLPAILPGALVAPTLIACLAAVYVTTLLTTADPHSGRLAAGVAWLLGATAINVGLGDPAAMLVAHGLLLWVVRATTRADGVLRPLLLLAVAGIAVLAALATVAHTGSPALATWCHFLVLAAGTLLPTPARERTAATQHKSPAAKFDAARQRAEAALRRLGET